MKFITINPLKSSPNWIPPALTWLEYSLRFVTRWENCERCHIVRHHRKRSSRIAPLTRIELTRPYVQRASSQLHSGLSQQCFKMRGSIAVFPPASCWRDNYTGAVFKNPVLVRNLAVNM